MTGYLYRNPRILTLALILTVFVGLAAFRLLPNSEDPELVPRFVTVLTRWPGANAERIDSLVTEKIEEKLEEVEEVDELNAYSRSGISFVGVRFKDNVSHVELDQAITRVQEKLSQVQPELPRGASIPELNDNFMGTITLIAAVTWNDDSPIQHAVLLRHAEELADTLRRVPDTNFAKTYGEAREEVVVEVDPAQLNALGLTVSQLAATIKQSDAKVLAGQLHNDTSDLIIEVGGEFESLDQIRQIPVATGTQGHTVWLSDIAKISKGVADPPLEMAFIDGRRGIAVVAQMESGRRIEVWTRAALSRLEEFQSLLPAGVEFDILFEQNQYTQDRLRDLATNLLIGMALVFGSTFLMMGWQSSVLVATALPLSVLMTLAGMQILDLGIHQMSIIGLIIALGLLIDNAIIIVDEINRNLKDGADTETAITASVKHLSQPLLGSTLTTVFAFTPLALMPGPVGDFSRACAITVILALSSSLAISLTFIPVLAGLLHDWRGPGRSDSFVRQGISPGPALRRYTRLLDRVLTRPLVPAILIPAISLLGFYSATLLAQEFFPFSDRDHFSIQLQVDSHASLGNTQDRAMQVRELLMEHEEVTNVHWFIGTNSPHFFYSMGGTDDGSTNYAQALVQLRDNSGVNDFIIGVQRELDLAFPGAQILVSRLGHGSKPAAAIEVDVTGPDLHRLREIGEDIRAVFAGVPAVTHTTTSLKDGRPKFVFETSEEENKRAGLSNVAVADQLDTALVGTLSGSLFEETEEVPIRVRLAHSTRSDLTNINSVNLVPGIESAAKSSTSWVPLAGLGEMTLQPGIDVIPRRDGVRSNKIQAYVPPESAVSRLGMYYKDQIEEIRSRLPAGYALETGGEEEDQQDNMANVMAYVGILVVIMIATLVIGMRSFRIMAIVAFVAVMSLGFGLAALAAFDIPFGFGSVIGLVGLTGVAINDSIVVLAAMHADARVRRGDAVAARHIVTASTRHVLATSLTTMAGLLPLMVSNNALWTPMAVAIGGGVFGATGLALFFSPAAYMLLMPTLRGFEREFAKTSVPADAAAHPAS